MHRRERKGHISKRKKIERHSSTLVLETGHGTLDSFSHSHLGSHRDKKDIAFLGANCEIIQRKVEMMSLLLFVFKDSEVDASGKKETPSRTKMVFLNDK